jgi:hypothetical protein
MAMAPSGPVEARIALLQRFLDIFEALDAAIAAIEAEEAAALGMTKGAMLPEVVGLGVVSVAGYVAFVGDPARFDNRPERIWRALGADPPGRSPDRRIQPCRSAGRDPPGDGRR